MKVNSFFCGGGGMDLGFIQAGFEVVGAWDFDKYAVESYTHNIGMHVEQMSVLDMKGSDVPNVNGWLFGFPCQDISVAGKQKGMIKGETRSGLFYEIMRLLDEVEDKPEWILAENVKAVNKLIPVIEKEYDKAGYVLVSPQLYNTKYWFLPQNRERFFLLGLRKDLVKTFTFPEQQTDFIPKLSSILETDVDEKYYIDDLKAAKIIEQAMERIGQPHAVIIDSSQEKREGKYRIYEESSPTLAARDYKDPRMVIENGIGKITVLGHLEMFTYKSLDEVYDIDGVSPAVTTSQGGHRQPKILEKYRVRKLTPREYARLQGFPDSYEQIVSNSQFYKQMGNAVSVPVAYAIAKAIKEQL